jgi:N-methylhydantoinase B
MRIINASVLEIVWKRLISSVDEAQAAIIRTAFSTSIRESLDFACALTTAKGELLAQATQAIPVFVGSIPRSVKILTAMPEFADLKPDDVVITNDPWIGTGHLPDITVVAPIFHRGQRVGYSASTAHEIDIGGRNGSFEMKDIFEEGLQIPPLKLISGGKTDETIVAFIHRNIRNPDEFIGDLWSQVGALDIIAQRTVRLLEEYELEDLEELAEELFQRTQAALQTEIAKIPPGTYCAEVTPDGLPMEVTVKMALTFDGKSCHVDFDGSSPQVPEYSLNCPMPFTYAYTAFAIKCLLVPNIPNTEGIFRTITMSAPEGCCVNSVFPTSGLQRQIIGHHLPACVMAALSEVLPDRTIGKSGSGPMWYLIQTGVSESGRPYANMFFFNGGTGGSSHNDGANALSWPTNISGVPVEFMEYLAPLKFERKALREGSGGRGTHRGGLGLDVAFVVTGTAPINVILFGGAPVVGPFGVAGGERGAPGEALINGQPLELNKHLALTPGDRVVIRTPGGGGYGDPAKRSLSLRQIDVSEGYDRREAGMSDILRRGRSSEIGSTSESRARPVAREKR